MQAEALPALPQHQPQARIASKIIDMGDVILVYQVRLLLAVPASIRAPVESGCSAAGAHRRAVVNGPGAWASVTHLEDSVGTPDGWIQSGPVAADVIMWGANQQIEDISVFCLSPLPSVTLLFGRWRRQN